MTRPPDSSSLRLSTAFIALLSLASIPLLATAQQQQVSHNDISNPSPSSQRTWSDRVLRKPQASASAYKSAPRVRTSSSSNKNENALASTDVSALATLAPDGLGRAVRAPPARSPGAAGSLSSRHLPARSLQDWEVEDIVLLATVDGKIHARDRISGEHRWKLESVSPMVETIYHDRNESANGDGGSPPADYDFLFIVEPSQDGNLYTFSPNMPLGMRKMHLTVKQLVEELSPWTGDDPAVVYTGEQKSTLYTIDIASGNIIRTFNTANISINSPPKRPQAAGLGSLDSEEKCFGTLDLTRTEYIVSIQDKLDGTPICTIKYFEWGPDKRNRDLQMQRSATKDSRYIYSLYDGRIMSLDHSKDLPSRSTLAFEHKFESPVARVFDVARPRALEAPDTPRIILPQPDGRNQDGGFPLPNEKRVFVDSLGGRTFFALSEETYPMVTADASNAQCLASDGGFHKIPTLSAYSDYDLQKALIGVHSLSVAEDHPGDRVMQISGPTEMQPIDYPEDVAPVESDSTITKSSWHLPYNTEYPLILLVLLISGLFLRQQIWPRTSMPLLNKAFGTQPMASRDIVSNVDDVATALNGTKVIKSVKFVDDHPPLDVPGALENVDPASVPLPEDQDADFDTVTTAEEPKKKARRGKRGGSKVKKAKGANEPADVEESMIEAVKQDQQQIVAITPDAINNEDAYNSVGLQNLIIRTQEPPLGSGSGGTFVFKGEFEGREVAVKRMLPQYFELMSQEVSMLEQNEDHPNVIRYFCRRQDQHFLYIALELCQASLYELFKDGRGDEIDSKFYPVRDEIVRDPRAVLRQLAEGLHYLHKFRIVHRDIKPQNMLIAFPKKNTVSSFPRLVISDFGLCKTLPDNVSTLIGTTGNAGTAGWKAPELIFQPRETTGHSTSKDSHSGDLLSGSLGVKRAIDIFSMGCVFFYVFTHGKHPFDDEEGWTQLRERNIKTNRPNFGPLAIYADSDPDIINLIQRMLSPEAEERPTAAEVLAHPFFWSPEDRLDFLSVASDRFDQEPRDGTSWQLEQLERYAETIIPWNTQRTTMSGSSMGNGTMALEVPERSFLARLDPKFVMTLGKQRKYQGHKVVDLLRALRNKHHHWDDMPDDVKRKVGELPEGYLGYWEERFPGLVLNVWMAVMKVGWEKERRFRRFFAE